MVPITWAEWSGPADGLWTVERGTKRGWHWSAVRLDGAPVRIPVVVLAGREDGPQVAGVAGVHGNEWEGQYALQDLARELEPAALRGTLSLVLCANPLAAEVGQRRAPQDGLDLNRAFPGDRGGSVSQRLAAALFDLVRGVNGLLTLHSWSTAGEVLPYVEYPRGDGPAQRASRGAACACGLARSMALDWHPGLLPAAAVRAGVPAIEIEIGGRGASEAGNRALYREATLRVLRHWGVLPRQDIARMPSTRDVRAHHLQTLMDGALRLHVALGQHVRAGQPLAVVVGLDGGVRAELVAPVDGEIGAVRHLCAVRAGDRVVTIFEQV
jgi:predicted deacylase